MRSALARYLALIVFAALAAYGLSEWLVARAAPERPTAAAMSNDYPELSGPDVTTVVTPSRLAAELQQQQATLLSKRLVSGQWMGGSCVFSYTGRNVGPDDPNTYVSRSLAYSDERCVQLVAEWVVSGGAATPLESSPAPGVAGPTPTPIEAATEPPPHLPLPDLD